MNAESLLIVLGAALLLGGPMSDGSSRAHFVTSHPSYLAQASCENSLTCCIRRFPKTAAESCGATAVEIAEALNGVKVLHEASQSEEETQAATNEDDFANNRHLPEWKQECIRNYVACRNEPDWTGPCLACLRRCEGQQDWPFGMCWPPGKKEK